MPENNAEYNVYNNYTNGNIDTGNAAPVLEPEISEEQSSDANSLSLSDIVKNHLSVIIASIIIIVSVAVSTGFYSAAVKSNNELTSAQSTVSELKIKLDSRKSAYAAVLSDYDIDEEAEKLGMKKTGESIGIVLSEVTE